MKYQYTFILFLAFFACTFVIAQNKKLSRSEIRKIEADSTRIVDSLIKAMSENSSSWEDRRARIIKASWSSEAKKDLHDIFLEELKLKNKDTFFVERYKEMADCGVEYITQMSFHNDWGHMLEERHKEKYEEAINYCKMYITLQPPADALVPSTQNIIGNWKDEDGLTLKIFPDGTFTTNDKFLPRKGKWKYKEYRLIFIGRQDKKLGEFFVPWVTPNKLACVNYPIRWYSVFIKQD